MSKLEVSMATLKSDLPQGTLDLLILKVLALEPLHGDMEQMISILRRSRWRSSADSPWSSSAEQFPR